MKLTLTVPELHVTDKGMERKKEVQVVAAVAPGLVNDPAQVAAATLVQSAVFRRVTADFPPSIGGIGIPLYDGEVGEAFSCYVAIIEKDDDNRDLADTLKLLLGRDDVNAGIALAANSVLVGLGSLVTSLAARLPDLLTKDELLADYRYFDRAPFSQGVHKFAGMKAGGTLQVHVHDSTGMDRTVVLPE